MEKSKNAVRVSEEQIRAYYKEALALEAQMLINYLVDEIVMYDDKIEIFFHKPTRNSPDESRGCFVYKGRKENFDIQRYGSCETSRIDDSEVVERHLETPISLTGKRVKKEEPKTNNRQCLVFVLGSYWRRERDSEPPFARTFTFEPNEWSANLSVPRGRHGGVLHRTLS